MTAETLDERGFDVVHNLIDEQTVEYLNFELSKLDLGETVKQRGSVAFGIRNLLNAAPVIKDFSNSDSVRNLVESMLGKRAQVVRAIYFDKTPEANWKVPFHQDLTISVQERKDVEGFSSWTTKANIPHVQPPTSVLEKILALRVHLDDTDASNGALRVIVGSHRFGGLNAEQIENLKTNGETIICPVKKGGAMLMRPLLLHASSAATNANHRRVIHFEFSAMELPNGLKWFGS